MKLRKQKDGRYVFTGTIPMALARKRYPDQYTAVQAAEREGLVCLANGNVVDPDAHDTRTKPPDGPTAKTAKWTRGPVTVARGYNQSETIDGAQVHPCGLSVHRDTTPSGRPGLWIVTHSASGRVVFRFVKRYAARRFVELAADFTDWTVDRKTIEQAVSDFDYGRLRMLRDQAERAE